MWSQVKRKILVRLLGKVRYARHLGVRVGDGCRLYINYFGKEPFLVSIGNRVTITSGVRILTHDGSTWLMRDEHGRRQLFRRVTIGDDVFIGVNSIILPGVEIGNKVVIAAGSVVAKSVPSGVIVGGNPARIIGDFESYKTRVLEKYRRQDEWLHDESYKSNVLRFLDTSMKGEL